MATLVSQGTPTKVLTGARAIIYVSGVMVGFFNNVSYSVRQEKTPAFVIGAHSARELTPVSQEAVQLNMAGFRLIGGGPNKVGFARLSQLLMDDVEITVKVNDRRSHHDNGAGSVFEVINCKVLEHSGGTAAKSVSDFRLTLLGLRFGDESKTAAENDENGALSLKAGDIDKGTSGISF